MRLTREQMSIQFPNQWFGLKEPVYLDDDGVTKGVVLTGRLLLLCSVSVGRN